MSNALYDEIWAKSQSDLDEVVRIDATIQSTRSVRERSEARVQTAELYVRYTAIANNLEECYDLMVQPQKRPLLRRLLDCSLGRLLELKHELVEIELSEYTYCDDAYFGRKVTPEEMEVRIPRYFRREREGEIEERRRFIESTLRSLGELEDKSQEKIISERSAIRLIQAHERARQGRVRFLFMKEILDMKERSMIRKEIQEPDPLVANRAATLVQTVWRGYNTRRKIRQRKLDEMSLIGMLHPHQTITENARKVEKIEKERYEQQGKFKQVFENFTSEAKERIRLEKSALMEENMRIEIRNWIGAYYKQTGKIPELPSIESGGSRVIFSRQDTESSLSKSTGVSSSKESKRSKKSSANKMNKKDSEQEAQSEADSEMLCFKPTPSNFLNELSSAAQEYQESWRGKDESGNIEQGPYLEMIEAEKTREIENEVRLGVDHALRNDIEALQAALDRDKGYKGKRPKKAQKRVRRSGKKGKRKKEKDLTPDRTTESLFEELLQQGIIKLHPEVRIDSYEGQHSFANFKLRQKNKDPLPSIGDIRQIMREYCILPLGSCNLRELTPLVRSMLIAGPEGSGKKMLVHAICTELGATLFDITPANIAGKYPGKSGLIMLLHLISKVSRLLQPSVIYMEDAEKPFVKKVAKTDKTDPKRLKKDLPKLVKNITNEDRIMMIGTSRCPWEGDQKLMYQTYDKVIFVPRPDYGSISTVWKNLLYKYSGISRQFDTSGMAKLCDGFTIGTIVAAINEVMTTKRMVQLKVRPLTQIELINALSLRDPVYKEEEDTFLNWYSKTPTCRKKQRSLELELAKLEEANEKRKKKGKKK